MLKIGNVELENPWILAPMAGICDLPFRLLCREMGAGMVCTEMISAKAIFYNNKNTEELMNIGKDEGIVSMQIFGSDPEIMGDMAKRIEDKGHAILDINMGCPVPKVVNNKEGSALMKDPLLAGRIIERVAGSTVKPLTVKIRKGFDENNINAPEIAHIAEESGAAAVIVHGRTREEYYSGQADLDIIRQVKERVSIPVIGNGDVNSYESGVNMMEKTGCDGVMIGRAARGNPWIFKELNTRAAGLEYKKPSMEEILDMLIRHAKMLVAYKGEFTGIREMRKHSAWYLSGVKNASKIRGKLNYIETFKELEEMIGAILDIKSRNDV
ncbi:MAG: tRNA dihydrouridine synthase DusB [Lachnospiraceae bacterium]|nr:tRNA dihydrouridine synthase DusB [Lachnospiraceae bacterium]